MSGEERAEHVNVKLAMVKTFVAEVELRSPNKLRADLLSRQNSAPCRRQQCIIVSHARRSPEGGARETWRINACECRSLNHVARSVRKAQASRRRDNDLCSLFRRRPCDDRAVE